MSAFKYIQENGKTYLVIDNRMKIRWAQRFVPAAESVTVLPSSVSLNKSTLTLKVEGTETLTATILPSNTTDKSVTWASSDETVATVSNEGLVTAVKVGTAKITCTSKANTSLKAECALTVEAKEANSEPEAEAGQE